MRAMETIDWSRGTWTNPPVATHEIAGELVVEAAAESDAWRTTSYGFIHDSEHALLCDFPTERAVEVDVRADFDQQFDQAGIFLRQDGQHWIKAGLEHADGVLHVGAVVTWPVSDWSVAPVSGWDGRVVTIRASRSGDAITVRARPEQAPWQLVRVIPVPESAQLMAGPLVCAPSRAGLRVRFSGWRMGAPDESLH